MKLISFSSLVALITSFGSLSSNGAPSILTADEKAAGWEMLFDGVTTNGWVALGRSEFPSSGWSVKDGALHHEKKGGGGDIVTKESYGNFELTWEWKIGEIGNSGVKYNLPDPTKGVGFEYQMLDDEKHSDGAKKSHQTAALYDLIEPSPERKTKPAGEWNQSRLVVDGVRVEQWLNGGKTVEFEIGSPQLLEQVAKSKYAKVKGFGLKCESPILIQDHGDEIDVRSIKIRKLTKN